MRALTGLAMTINRRQSLAALFAVALVMTVSLSIATVAAAQSPGYRVVHGWPQLPEGRVLGLAAGVGVDSHGAVLVFHRGPRIWSEPLPTNPIEVSTVAVFDGASGKLLREWGAGQFAMPHGLSVDHQDNVWVTDVALHQVFKYSPDGKLLLTLGERGRPGDDGGHFNRPTDVAVLPDGSFYVSDGYRNTRVAKFSVDGECLFMIACSGLEVALHRISASKIAECIAFLAPITVLDRMFKRLQKELHRQDTVPGMVGLKSKRHCFSRNSIGQLIQSQ